MSWFGKMFKGSTSKDPEHSPQADKGQEVALKAEEADEVLPEDNRSLIMQLISKNGLSMGMDLSKVPLPTFILEPRSLLEKLGDTVIHPEHFVGIGKGVSPEERIVNVVRWYMSAYHKRPRGVKKPFNPILGETFSGRFVPPEGVADKTAVNWTAEQVSHHPPISAFYAHDDAKSVVMMGHFAPKSRFLGNSAASIGEGGFRIFLPEHNEVYFLTWPTVYVRGILFGTLLMEIGGPVAIRCPQTGLHADIEFVVKGYFSGTHHAVKGSIYRSANPNEKKAPRDVLYTIEGNWHKKVSIKPTNGETAPLFDFEGTPMGDCIVSDAEMANPNSSRVIWAATAVAVAKGDQDEATKQKTAVEDAQRKLRAERAETGETFKPQLFSSSLTKETDELEFLGPNAVKFPSLE